MTAAPTQSNSELVPLAAELYDFLLAAEKWLPGADPNGTRERLLSRARELQAAVAAMKASTSERAAALLEEAHQHLRTFSAALKAKTVDAERTREAWHVLGKNYEALRAYIKQTTAKLPRGVSLRNLKPTNIARNVFHLAMALIGVVTYELVESRTVVMAISGSLLTVFIGLDVGRRLSERFNAQLVQKVFGLISRPGEAHQVPAATWYILGLFVGVTVLPQYAVELGVLILGIGDPVASLVGKRFGRVKIVGPKSLAGTIAFVTSAMIAAAVFVGVVMPPVGAATAAMLIVLPPLAGAAAELFSEPIDDNLTIPLVAGAIAAAILAI